MAPDIYISIYSGESFYRQDDALKHCISSKPHLFFCLLVQLLTVISTIDDLNYPEKTDTYYIVNAPYVFSTCWKVSLCLPSLERHPNSFSSIRSKTKSTILTLSLSIYFSKVVKPLLQERTRRKVQVLQGCGRDELLKVSDMSII